MNSNIKDGWVVLFQEALIILKSAKIPKTKWTFGGGTALMLWFNHRMSRDVDIFMTDAQYLNYLTPRLNDTAYSFTDDYTESSNFLKLKLKEGEIDFIIAPHLSKNPSIKRKIKGEIVNLETPEEIILKKIFYRAEGLKVRDIVDIAMAIKRRQKILLKQRDLILSKAPIILDRLDKLKEIYLPEAKRLQVIDNTVIVDALQVVKRFLHRCQNDPR